jgi:hypothetical protein
MVFKIFNTPNQACGSGSSILAQSGSGPGSTKSLNPNSMWIWIQNRTLEDKFLKFKFKIKNTVP